ncbi:MAG: DUF4160 domain-containing protein [Acidobacteria bacterium]|nr:DUF4160 domain-containing protein [Acidobacteriota bacterium]
MPVISMFYGIIVSMYFADNRRHKVAHIHVKYQEHEVVLTLPEGEILEGSIPANRLKLVLAWIEIHRDELIADWELAASGQQPYKIEPLR